MTKSPVHRQKGSSFTFVLLPEAVLSTCARLSRGTRAMTGVFRKRANPQGCAGTLFDVAAVGVEEQGTTATLLQFSTDACHKSVEAHYALASIAAEHDGVVHVDVDISGRDDLAARYNIVQTPTVLVLDSGGTVHARFGGAPSPVVVELELASLERQVNPASVTLAA